MPTTCPFVFLGLIVRTKLLLSPLSCYSHGSSPSFYFASFFFSVIPGFITKVKSYCSWIYYYFAMIMDKIIDILNGISKDYREITEQLRKERKEKRQEKIRKWRLGYTAVRASQRMSEAATGSDSDMLDGGKVCRMFGLSGFPRYVKS